MKAHSNRDRWRSDREGWLLL